MTSGLPGHHHPSSGKELGPANPEHSRPPSELPGMSDLLQHSGRPTVACVSHAPRKFKSFPEQPQLVVRHLADSRTATGGADKLGTWIRVRYGKWSCWGRPGRLGACAR